MQLSVIILNYKVPYYLLQCLRSLEKSLENLQAEIIVVDNCSEDESCALVKTHFPKVVLLENKKNEGFSKGNNRGVKIAQGEYICLLNPDTAVSETVFENVLQFAKNHPDFGAIGVKMIDGTGNFLPESKRNLPTPKVAFQKLLGNGKNYYAQLMGENETGKIDILPGAFMFMKKARYWEVGGLDEAYFMYGEDIDLSYKFIKNNYQNYYLGTENILHYKGESTVKNSEYLNRFYGAMQLFHQKHFRSNWAVDVLVKTGLEAAKMGNRLRSENPKKPEKIQKTVLVTEGKSTWELLKKTLGTQPTIVSFAEIEPKKMEKTRVIFDAETLSYAQIFTTMEQLKNKGNRFRILPEKLGLMIGSDSSDHKGEVVLLETAW